MIAPTAEHGGAAQVSWAAIARRLRPYVRRQLGSDHDADDVLQEVLLKMHGGLAELRDDDRLVPWAFGIARRAIVDHRRARIRLPTPVASPPEVGESVELPREGSDDEYDALTAVIASFVAALPSPYREAIVLTELQGRSQREAAEMVGVSLTAMKSRVQRGREKLRRMLERCCAIELDVRNRVVGVVPRADGRVPDGCCDDDGEAPDAADAETA